MKFKTLMFLSAAFWTLLAAYNNSLAATYVSLGCHAILYMLHVLEVKVNKLLDAQGIHVNQSEIDHD